MTPHAASAGIDLAQEPDFQLGDLKVSPSACRLAGQGREAHLTPRTMQVLVVLAQAAGHTVSRDQLIESCWAGRAVSDDAVSNVLGKLRAVARLFDPPPFALQTVHKVGFRLRPREHANGEVAIAVLPFHNMTSDPEQEYFSDGLSEELITQHGHLRLRVATASAVGPQDQNVSEIGKHLHVDHVVQGSLRRSGRRLRVAARLVSCSDGRQLWSHTYDGELTDIFAIQDQMASAIGAALDLPNGQ